MKNVEREFAHLRECLNARDANGVQRAIFDLGAVRNGWTAIPDEVVEGLLALLRSDDIYTSHLAGHVLNFFEFEAPRLSERQKWLCIGFLKAHGDEFKDTHSRQVVAELREANYLTLQSPE